MPDFKYLKHYVADIKISAQRAMFGGANAEPGIHCRYCRARFKCEVLQKTSMNAIDVINNNVPQVLNGNSLAFEYTLLTRAMKLLQYRTDALKEQIVAELKAGNTLPGWILEQSYGRKRWSKELPTEQIIEDMSFWGLDIRKPDNIDTPTQVMTKLKKKIKENHIPIEPSVIEQYIEIPMTGMKIVEDTDSKIRASFAKYINPEAIPNE